MSNPEEEIDRLQLRIDRLEGVWLGEIKEINVKLTQMAITNASRKECPAPGSCLILKADVERALKWLSDHEKKLQSLEKWQASLVAGFALLMIVLTLFAPSIRAILHLP